MADFGIPYMGSKGGIIHRIAPIFPAADNFYDLFGGGFSVSHYMLYHHSKKYKRFLYNEIKSDVVQLVKDAIAGKYNYDVFKPEWISRERFFAEKDSNAYIRCIWSFGNNQKCYMFSEENERNKRSLHNAVVFNEFDALAISILKFKKFPDHLSIRGRRLACRQTVVKRKGELEQLERLERLQQLEHLQQLQQLEQLERLQQLEHLQQLQQLEFSSRSYSGVEILPNSVVYCDPPYKGTTGYLGEFDHKVFWDWVMDQAEPVFVSEYQAPPMAKVIMALNHKKKLSHKGCSTDSVEKLFGNEAAVKSLASRRL